MEPPKKNIHQTLGLITAFFLIGFLTMQCEQTKPNNSINKSHTNLLIVLVDQWRGQALGFLKKEPVKTPNLDKLANEGIVLRNMISNSPVCSPFRAMFMTGMYPSDTHVNSNCTSNTAPMGCELQKSDTCWSDILHNKGYSLGYIGKWHLDSPIKPYIDCKNNEGDLKWNEWCPPSRRHGFDFWHSYGTYDYHLNPLYWSTNAPRDSFHIVDEWGPVYEANLAIDYIEDKKNEYRQANKPFALVVSMNPPHMPYDAVPEKYKKLYEDIPMEDLTTKPNIPLAGTRWGDYYRKNIKNYYAMMTGVDEQVGRILNTLKEQGYSENTIVVFTSDHGNCLGIHDKISKSNYYEESVRVPFIIRWPKKINARNDDLLMSSPDIYPTLIELMGFENEIPERVTGTSYASIFLTGKGKRPKSQLYIHPGFSAEGKRGVMTDRYTLVLDNSTSTHEYNTILFDRENDPYQLNNVAAENENVVIELTNELIYWLQKSNDPWSVKL